MTETLTKFSGDDEHDDKIPQDFMDSIEILFIRTPSATDAQKLRAFKLHLRSGSVAKQWWIALPTNRKDTWERLAQAFQAKWPVKTPTVKTIEEKRTALEGTRITEEEIGTRVKIRGVEELAHVIWADKIERLAAAIPDTNGLLIGNIRKTMPKILQKVTGSGHTDWASFCNAVRTATLTQIDEAKEEEKEARNLREEMKKLQELRNAPTRDLTNTFQRLTMGTSAPAPRFPTPRTQPLTQTHNAYRQFANPTPPQPAYRPNRPPAVCMEDVTRLALPIHPDTQAGRASYNSQVMQWNTNNPRQFVSELQPYPLSPGTSPVASGECWKCGHQGHFGPNCDAPSQIPQLEQRWRSIAATIKRNSNTTTTGNVNYVTTDDAWLSREEYDRRVIANFLAEQGKEQGSSA